MNNENLIKEALFLVNPQSFGKTKTGNVGCALVTNKNTIFKGVSIDTICGMGFCAEHSAISQMITQGEFVIQKIVAVKRDEDGNIFILAPCGRCREFMYQIHKENLEHTEIVLDSQITIKLDELLPYPNRKKQQK